jgi:hypothetical protein
MSQENAEIVCSACETLNRGPSVPMPAKTGSCFSPERAGKALTVARAVDLQQGL